jgi:hypothetical protein
MLWINIQKSGPLIIAYARERDNNVLYMYLHTCGICKYYTGVRAKHAFANIIRHCGTEPTVQSSAHRGKNI